MSSSNPIRVAIVQPSLAHYRVPLFAELARVPELAPHVFYATTGRKNAEPTGFNATPIERRSCLSKRFYWMPTQLDVIDPTRFDVAIFEWNVHYLSLTPALIKAKRHKVKSILWGHGQSANDGTWRAWPRTSIARRADALITYSHGARDRLIANGFNPAGCFVAPNSIDQTPIQSARNTLIEQQGSIDSARAAMRRQMKLSSDLVLLFVSRLEELRRVDVLLRAIAKCKATGTHLEAVIVGDGPNRPALEQLSRELKIDVQIRWEGALYDEAELAKRFVAADVFVFPSYMGLSVLHAFGYGLPAVIGDDRSAHGPEAEAVIDARTGLTFRHNDPDDLAEKLLKLLRNKDLLRSLAGEAHHVALHDHTIKRMVHGISEAIQYVSSK